MNNNLQKLHEYIWQYLEVLSWYHWSKPDETKYIGINKYLKLEDELRTILFSLEEMCKSLTGSKY
jgi:hypothetical protein